MADILFLQYPKCSTCQKAAKWLKENNISVDSRDISKDNPTRDELSAWIKKSGLPIAKFFNTSGKIYKEENLKEKVKSASEDELIGILSSNGMVVKRPIIVAKGFVLVGFNEEEWSSKLK
ncbi:arsenate reductase [Dysgonomonas sp. PFB1-18]|uniref:arsenate reductase family protein n=1 Tax=unclassified Dysgonomonas TaxID=2630389 RepID=UPI0024741D87|nr:MULTISPECIES: arsenate reductase family protein [unclassified Dysgonomonas]MDH6307134.1 arsenate reductase [Dysgonomonas sp. PF1-14]MDH6337053.1 arsenate reductase [Dysgonomonas sp. PF1-16]MDH6381039.1 arsenate reductase [Dysgonomonas sp. PFB1-18]MDH6396382.1 arsenate reductase [Dysgonomonas sp. PF1-23]